MFKGVHQIFAHSSKIYVFFKIQIKVRYQLSVDALQIFFSLTAGQKYNLYFLSFIILLIFMLPSTLTNDLTLLYLPSSVVPLLKLVPKTNCLYILIHNIFLYIKMLKLNYCPNAIWCSEITISAGIQRGYLKLLFFRGMIFF